MNKLSTDEIVKTLIEQYDNWASIIDENNRCSQGFWLESVAASVYVRNMARGIISGELVLCLATIDIEEKYQGQGILTSFLEYIENNMHSFKEIEIENIQTKQLLRSMFKKGFIKTNNMDIDKYIIPSTVCKKIKG